MFRPGYGTEKIRIARSFGQAAGTYDRYALLQREVADKLLSRLKASDRTLRILDLGSGTGYCARALLTMFPRAEIVSLDLAESMLRIAKAGSRSVTDRESFICADAEALPFADASFDLIVSSLAIQWCHDYADLFAELKRIGRPGAAACLATFESGTLSEVEAAWRQADAGTHVNRFTDSSELTRLALLRGFANASVSQEVLLRYYPDFMTLARELKGIGASYKRSGPLGLGGRSKLRLAREAFERGTVTGKGIPVTYALAYLTLKT